MPYSVASDSKLLETSRGLGTGGPAIAVSSAREGEKVWNVHASLRDTVLDPNLVVYHDYGLKNRCSPSRFREIASGNLSLDGGSTLSDAGTRPP
jgi:hypothetical protein